MRKTIFMMFAMLALPALAVTVKVDGEALPAQPAPILANGRVLVPLRAVFQALDAKVDYKNSTITAVRDGQTVVLRPNQTKAQVNGETVTLDEAARLVNGTTYVPLRFVAQALGEKVAWQAASKTVVIGEGGLAVEPPDSRIALAPVLNRLVVGNQGGVLKVWDETGSNVAYYRGLDDRSVAPISLQDQEQILGSLGLSGSMDSLSRQLMTEYGGLTKQKEALALLGVMNSLPAERLPAHTASQVRTFLAGKMKADPSVYNRRQATLALAVGSAVDQATVNAVVDFYKGSDNLWETFPVQQFFEYQAGRVREMPNFSQVRQEVLSVNSLYRENIAGFIGG